MTYKDLKLLLDSVGLLVDRLKVQEEALYDMADSLEQDRMAAIDLRGLLIRLIKEDYDTEED